uniref:Transcriptional regulator n=1 Tax=Steinernema glaseri TaxID=37863 RepID=A0A1I7XYM0_9BILA
MDAPPKKISTVDDAEALLTLVKNTSLVLREY